MLRLLVGDDWAEDHHDVELMGAAGRVLARARLPGGWRAWPGCMPGSPGSSVIPIPMRCRCWPGSGPAGARGWRRWPRPGYEVFAVNPLQAAQYRERHAA
jgi:hypothetical protein